MNTAFIKEDIKFSDYRWYIVETPLCDKSVKLM
ncbi:hypothetical protein SCREM1_59 [Synechococcus phage S-CREM1]|nr:hypothetical protein SCREM1_59 [Synechococcus phage S-CREM1]